MVHSLSSKVLLKLIQHVCQLTNLFAKFSRPFKAIEMNPEYFLVLVNSYIMVEMI
jgi:hypothetical protein